MPGAPQTAVFCIYLYHFLKATVTEKPVDFAATKPLTLIHCIVLQNLRLTSCLNIVILRFTQCRDDNDDDVRLNFKYEDSL